ncbi:uncharacterized protein LOC132723052 [Ruditapes philippinarum]|uniref:uncharacterized protein LOC132723052 n=1 Tax=Ruditapes philippinarum TaxID=129788 RepID=UPI00295C2C50|nr:uncharacterized protein LOC132723052 [Ruditapes philippinarum]
MFTYRSFDFKHSFICQTAVGVHVSNQTGQCSAIFSLPDNNQTITDEYTYAIKISEEESYKPSVPFDELEDKVWAFPGGIKNGTVVELIVTMPIGQKEDGEGA